MTAAAAGLRPHILELETGLSHPPRLGYLWEPRIEHVLLDLAIQTAGAVSVPLPETEGEIPSYDHKVELPAALDLDQPAPRLESISEESRRVYTGDGGGVCVRDSRGRSRDLRADELAATAAGLGLTSRFAPSSVGRAIWVSGRPLWDPAERLVLTATLVSGAAVVLASPETHVPTAAWARPTVFSGDAAEVTALVQTARSYRSPLSRRWARWVHSRVLYRDVPPPPPFDRLRTVLVRTEEARELSKEISTYLLDRGVELLPLPIHPDAAPWRRSYNIELRGGKRGGTR